MSNFSIILNSKNHPNTADFTTVFPRPIELKGLQYQIALTRLDTSYSWYNISAELGNNIFKYNNGTDDQVLTIDNGCYSFVSLVNEIHDLMIVAGDYTVVDDKNVFSINFELDLSDSHTNMFISDSYTVDFTTTAAGLAKIFGFNSAVYSTSTLSQQKSNILNDSSYIYVHLDIVSGSTYIDGQSTDVISSFAINFKENEVISFVPDSTVFLPINTRFQINSIRLYLTDDQFKPINLQKFPLKAEFIAVPILNF